jgi:hypothetical protein
MAVEKQIGLAVWRIGMIRTNREHDLEFESIDRGARCG